MVKEKVDPISQIHSLNAGKVLFQFKKYWNSCYEYPEIDLYEIAHMKVDLTLLQKMYVIQGGSSEGKESV